MGIGPQTGAGGVRKEIKNSSSKGGTLQTGSTHNDEDRRRKNKAREDKHAAKLARKKGYGIF